MNDAEAEGYRCPAGLSVETASRTISINEIDSLSWVALSPDGQTLLVRKHREVLFASRDGSIMASVPRPGPSFGVSDVERSLAWSSASDSVWLLAGETAAAGWVTGPLSCARLYPDGRLVRTAALRNLPGRLDQIAWVDGEGLGIASLDTGGGYNRPELPDTAPALAVVQAERGAVRSVLPLRGAIAAAFGPGRGSVVANVLTTVRLRDGRVRALLRCGFAGETAQDRVGGFAIWTEGAPLQPITFSSETYWDRTVFTPDGRHLLTSHLLTASGPIFERQPSPTPVPTTGVYAAFYDLAGDEIWRLEGTANDLRSPSPVALSGDGRLGLISLPKTCGYGPVWAVVELRNGTIERQLVMNTTNNAVSVGFDGRSPWLASYQQLRFFD